MNNPDRISEILETIFLGYNTSLMRIRDPGWEKFGSGIQNGKNSDPGETSRIRNTMKNNFFMSPCFCRFRFWRGVQRERGRAGGQEKGEGGQKSGADRAEKDLQTQRGKDDQEEKEDEAAGPAQEAHVRLLHVAQRRGSRTGQGITISCIF